MASRDYAHQRLLGGGYCLLTSVYQCSANAQALERTYELAVCHHEKLRAPDTCRPRMTKVMRR
ncbi:MAG TPA: hypothetical protein VFL86_19135 [Burkholderiaceae bacterium]|nr:hypothetical protein [Burkholderiaceae bacterium]